MEEINRTVFVEDTGHGLLCGESEKVNGNECMTYFGQYWDDFEETASIGIQIVQALMEKGRIKGSTYIEAMLTEKGVPVLDLRDNNIENYSCEINQANGTLMVAYSYLQYVNKDIANKYDNIVCVVRDDPRYSHSGKDFITTSVIVNFKKEAPLIVNIGSKLDDPKLYPELDNIVKKVMAKKQVLSLTNNETKKSN